jgi:hypothetical protein
MCRTSAIWLVAPRKFGWAKRRERESGKIKVRKELKALSGHDFSRAVTGKNTNGFSR